MTEPNIAVILPCYNEEKAIGDVVRSFRSVLPNAEIYVFDNNSKDNTAAVALEAGALVRFVSMQGKGNVLRQAFAQVDADIYVMADGDGTYDAGQAPELVSLLLTNDLDMVIGVRKHVEDSAYRRGHVAGNRLFNWLVIHLFGRQIEDIFSGYRVMSRPFVKSMPALAEGFETETEMTLHAIELKLPFEEVASVYGSRLAGDKSKLNTYRDGFRILFYMTRLLKHMRPFFMFSIIGLCFGAASILGGIPIIVEYISTGLVPRFPTAIAASGLMILGAVSLVTGIILDGVAHANREQKRLAYLAVSRFMDG